MAGELTTTPSVGALAQGIKRLPVANRIGVLIATAAAIAVVVAAVMWGAAPDYRVLFSNLSDRDGGAIVQALGQMNVPYRFSEGGGAVLVPANQVHEVRLRLASQGLPRGGTVGFELMEGQKFGATQFQEQVSYQRALEGELAKSIQSLAAVQSARVHLAMPKPTVFLRDSQKPSASVLVNLHPGHALDRGQVAGIAHLVASSVPDLPLKAVSIVDQNGTLLSTDLAAKPGAQLDASQLAYVHQIEANFARRIVDILEPIAGRSNVRAQVTADLDFSESEATNETYKPNQNPQEATIRSQQTLEAIDSAGKGPEGVPGALTNQPAPAATAPIGANPNQPAQSAQKPGAPPPAPTSSRREMTTNYEVDKTVRHTRTPVGTIKRLSAAVVVNHKRVADGAAADAKDEAKGGEAKPARAKLQPLTADEMAQITALVKEAMGYSQARGDSLNVVNAPFAGEIAEPPPAIPVWKQPENVALAKDAGKSLVAAALVLVVLLGVLRPLLRQLAAPAQAAGAPIEGELVAAAPQPLVTDASLTAAKQLAKQDPKVVANVVRNWVSGSE